MNNERKPSWETPSEDTVEDLYLDSLAGVAVVLLIVMACCALMVLVYGLAQPWVNELIASWSFTP